MRLNSPLTPIINYQLSKLIQGGALSRIRKSYMGLDDSKDEFCATNSDEESVIASFSDVRLMFWILGFGVSLSSLFCYLEWISYVDRKSEMKLSL